MKLEGCIALVTGANRGLGKAYAEALLAAGAGKVYAAARDPGSITDKRVTPVRLDVTSPKDIAATAQQCGDANLIINNAGAMLTSHMLSEGSASALRREMEVNVFGVLEVSRAFAPVLAKNGGGAIANMLSVVSWFVNPINATYCASKYAALAVTDALRMELKAQGTHVVGVYAGYIDTDMAASLDVPKTTPQQVAAATLEGDSDEAGPRLRGCALAADSASAPSRPHGVREVAAARLGQAGQPGREGELIGRSFVG